MWYVNCEIGSFELQNNLNNDITVFRWSCNLFKRGYKHGITLEDLWQARSSDKSKQLGDKLEKAWEHEIQNAKRKGTKPSLAKAIIRSFWLEYMICGFFVGILFIILW